MKTIANTTNRRTSFTAAMLAGALFIYTGAPAAAMQILAASDHAELKAEISGTAVNRIALDGDRIAQVIRAPGGFTAEHDAARGDLYLRPAGPGAAMPATVTLFIGTARGFTYRLALSVAMRDSAQILIRNQAAFSAPLNETAGETASHPRVTALAALIRAVARREPLGRYTIEARAATAAGADLSHGFTVIEIWRGARFTAQVLEVNAAAEVVDAAALAARVLPGAAAVWLGAPVSGPTGGRLAVVAHAVEPPRTGAVQ